MEIYLFGGLNLTMIFFKVYGNVNVKIADNSLVVFKNYEEKSPISDNEIYCTSYDDSVNTAKILKKAGNKYSLEYIDFQTVKDNFAFPSQIGLSNFFELNKINNNLSFTGYAFSDKFNSVVAKYLPIFEVKSKTTTIKKIKPLKKSKISIAIIDPFNEKIGEILCGIRAIELLHEFLKKDYEEVTIDLYIQSIDRVHFIRDTEILRNSKAISFIKPLPISIKTVAKYDFFIDNSSLDKQLMLANLPKTDQFLLKFGLNCDEFSDNEKRLSFDFPRFNIAVELLEKLESAKLKGKLLLFHPYSPEIERSIPKDITIKLLRELVLEAHNNDFVIVSALKIDNFDDDCFVDLSKYSKTFFDFSYIVSQMDKIITTETATMYLADLFYIPTVVIFSNPKYIIHKKYHQFQKEFILNVDESLNISQFDTSDDRLTINKYSNYKALNARDLLNSLEF